jgi:mRNA-degrading endonuclease RelE of RelBE toxin-antitoxin system
VYRIEISRSAEDDLSALRAYDRATVARGILEQLSQEPTATTRNRKILEGHEVPFEAVPPIWELRVGTYRVFYDVNVQEEVVFVRAIRHKPPHKTTEEIL